jgi:hypothetical protein
MFRPVSTICYQTLNMTAQAIAVVGLDVSEGLEARLSGSVARWRDKTAGLYSLGSLLAVRDVVRDLLANPQIRAVVFDECPIVRGWFSSIWDGARSLDGIDDEHVALVRQFVDLYDGDFALRGPQQPFWPSRVMYLQ